MNDGGGKRYLFLHLSAIYESGVTINVPVVYMVQYKVNLRGDYP